MDNPHVFIDADLKDLIPGFLERRHADLSALRSHVELANFDDIKTIGHTLKGTAGGYGFDELSRLGAELEVAAKEASTEAVAACIAEMEGYLANLKIEFR